jgi:putative hydrolase of HD superfamily
MEEGRLKKTVNLIFEMNQLKREYHRGFALAGVREPDTIAEHSLRAAQIGYILACMENERAGEEAVDAEKVASMLIIHDNHEARVGDQHKVGARYMDIKEAEKMAFREQIGGLGKAIEEKWEGYMEEYKSRDTKEGVVAKDADWLETAFQAKEYLDLGYGSAIDWIVNVEKAVETESAKEIIAVMKETTFTAWWDGLKKMTYKKLG